MRADSQPVRKQPKRKPPVLAPGLNVPVRMVTRPAKTDAQAGYGLPAANAYKQTPEYKRTLVQATLRGRGVKKDLRDIKISADGQAALIKHRRALLPDDVQAVPLAQLLKGAKPTAKSLMNNQLRYGNETHADLSAGALRILNQTTRPIHGIAGGVDAAVQGRNPLTGVTRGLTLKDQTYFGDVLRHAGLPRGVAAAAGLPLDIFLDPTTYVSGGTSGIAEKQAAKESARIAAKAVAAGMSEETAARLAATAGRRAAAKAPVGRGVSVKLAGHEIPGVTKATHALGRPLRAAGRTAPGKEIKEIAGVFRPQLKPADADRAGFDAGRVAARQARALTNSQAARAQRVAKALQKVIKPEEYPHVVNAIETDRIGSLPAHLHEPAVFLRSEFRNLSKQRRRAGAAEGVIRDYFPHMDTADIHKALGVDDPGDAFTVRKGLTSAKVGSSKTRTDRRTIAVQNADGRALSENIPAVVANYGSHSARIISHGQFVRQIASAGRDYKPHTAIGAGESVYRLGHDTNGRYGLHKMSPHAIARVDVGAAHANGRLVILNDKTLEHNLASIQPSRANTALARRYDKVTGTWKRVATATPGFHVRNLIGDGQMAYLAQAGHRMPANTAYAARALKALGRDEKNPLARGTAVDAKHKELLRFAKEAEREGVIRSGYVGRELADLTQDTVKARGRGGMNKRLAQNREDLFRLSTYREARKAGLSPARAADVSLGTHIDYADLTPFERNVMRRIAPFYTFSARAIPIHAKALVQHPGKFANIAKVMGEAANAAGLPQNYASGDLTQYQQRAVPLPISSKTIISAGLPVNTLNELPTSLSANKYGTEIGNFAMSLANPVIKVPFELTQNYNTFFRRPITDPRAPLVAAPEWVKVLPSSAQKKLGVVHGYVDKRTGKKVIAWPAKTGYLVGQGPGPINLANQIATQGSNRRGQGTVAKVATLASGIRAEPIDPQSVKITSLLSHRAQLYKQRAALNQLGIHADNASPEYKRISAEIKTATGTLQKLSTARGDAVPLGGKSHAGGVARSSTYGIDPAELGHVYDAVKASGASAIPASEMSAVYDALRGN